MISIIRSHSYHVMLSQISTQLTNRLINGNNLKFGSTWAFTYEIELHMVSIADDVIGSSLYIFIAAVIYSTN